ncbi:protein kinase [Frankia sp. AgB1.9]|uniref:serine/threonine-protein kinase n=1 Tax=unclassified Frankia TaxID=2632575 RepID=UPI0019349EA8|nr:MULTISPECIES: serine/threonine-protein kinase [unclassified Frankia]MBL7490820.1 protein kinase [Frankia sp. AgW1.1]MBL7553787.1 protein kinase [Frankia sp. AgB1.9]MBL7618379.1 protein kinase [Frankia sp. AgB1.8]
MTVVDRARVAAALPGYTIGEELGSGAFGVVLAGRHDGLDRPVAVKVLANTTPQVATGFLVEARAVGQLDHPHIVRTHDCMTREDLCLLVMELLGGGTLARRRLRPQEACAVGLALADALALSHSRGILHRDIKPANVLLADSGQPKLADFGIAKIIEASVSSASQIVGTPRYMAPEQIKGEHLSGVTDLYALATTLYELLSGRTTAPPRTPIPEMLRRQLTVVPPPPPDVPAPLAKVVMRSLAKRREDRHPDAHAFADDLARAATDVFGRGWLRDAGVPVQVSDDLRDLTARPTHVRRRAPGVDSPDAPRQRRQGSGVAAAALAVAIAAGAALGGGVTWAAVGHRHPGASTAAAAMPAWRPGALTLGSITTVLRGGGTLTPGFTGDGGPASAAKFFYPAGIAIDPARGYLYVADRFNHRIRRVDTHGTISTVAGDGIAGYAGDGGPAIRAELNSPLGVAVAPDGSLYIADANNNRIRRVDANGIITTVAGTGTTWYGGPVGTSGLAFSGDEVPATDANLSAPQSVTVDARGDLYIADAGDDRIRRVDTHGIITTVAGTGAHGFGGDGGTATAAQFRFPRSLALGPDGSLYVADLSNERIRKISPQGVITTIAGNGTRGTTGDGGLAIDAELDLGLASLTVDQAGDIYLTSFERVRRIDTRGLITTLAGSGQPGIGGDGGPAAKATLAEPDGLAIDDGILYIEDSLGVMRAVRIAAVPCAVHGCPSAATSGPKG